MFFMITTTYPLHKQPEVMEAFRRVAERPGQPFSKQVGSWGRPDGKHGVIVYTILEIDDGKEKEALWLIVRAMREYSGIEGYNYDLDIVASSEEMVEHAAD